MWFTKLKPKIKCTQPAPNNCLHAIAGTGPRVVTPQLLMVPMLLMSLMLLLVLPMAPIPSMLLILRKDCESTAALS